MPPQPSKRVSDLPAGKLRQLMARLGEQHGTAARIPRVPRTVPLPLSFSQERLWFLDRLGQGGAAYHVPAAVRMRGPLDEPALERALAVLAQRHEALRTTFGERDGRPVQTVHAEPRLAMPRVDLSGLPAAARADELARISREEARRAFDLTRGPLVRAALVRLGAGDHLLALSHHHIVTDGWSLGVFLREVAAVYQGLDLPEPPVQPADVAAWERERLSGETLEGGLAFWRQRLAGLPPLELPADRPRPASPSFRGGRVELALPGETVRSLEALAHRERATPFMALLALFEILLLRYSGQSDFGVGTPVANRSRGEVEGLIGLFVNTLVLRADLSGEPGFAGLLRRVRETALEAFAHESLPFDKLVEELRPEREPGRNPLFQVLFTLQNQPRPKLRVGELDLELEEVDTGSARVDLTLVWQEREGGLAGTLEYSADLFERASAERLLRHMAVLLQGALADPELGAGDLPLLTGAERLQILQEWSGAAVPYPREATVHALFEEQAAREGGRVALESGEARLTYAELEARANQLARRLLRLGVGPESVVGLAVPRSLETVVALLGILKAGGAYLPLDPASPRERLAAMVEEARPRAIISLEPLLDRLPGGLPAVCLDRDRESLAAEPTAAVSGGAAAANLAYVLYTSGSTGRPKGVAVPHRGVVRLVRRAGFARLDAGETFLQLAPLSFDASTLEIWGPLCNGGRLVLAPAEPPSLADLGRLLARHGVTTLWLTAGLFHQMVDEEIAALSGLSQLLAGGDVLSPGHARRVVAALPGCTLINGYGPTENTTFTCCHPVVTGMARDSAIPIGRPIGNSTVYVVDQAFSLTPPGVPGELLTGGDGLARGYLGRPDLTAERFVPHPWSVRPGGRLYRTGDLARWRPDGTLDFLGRIDQQVKIRGFRIELGEIEAALLAHPDIHAAAVLALGEGGDRRLVACMVGNVPEPRAWLKEKLPDYMVPSAFVALDALPLTPNGKIDRRALAKIEPERAVKTAVAPRTPTEARLAEIWSEVLSLETVGVQDDFFDLGGHSLLATRLVSRVREAFGVELPLRRLFEASTIESLAGELEGLAAASAPPLRPVDRSGDLLLSFAQERLWFLDRLEPGNPAYNMPAAARLLGPLDVPALSAALEEIVRRHEALRTVFAEAGDGPVQRVEAWEPLELPVVEVTPDEVEARLGEEARAPFDLARGRMVRACLLRLSADEHVLTLTFHHIAADGWSIGVFLRELSALYSAFRDGRPSPLPEPPVQYADFAIWQRESLATARRTDLAYWTDRLSGEIAPLDFPTDRTRPAVQTYSGGRRTRILPPGLTARLNAFGREHGATLFMILLAAAKALLHRHSGQEDILIGAPVAGRRAVETEGLIGCFLNTLALRTHLGGGPSFCDLVARVREVTLDAYSHQDVPFEAVLASLPQQRDLSRTPLFQVMVNLLNLPSPELSLPELAIENLAVPEPPSKFDMTFYAREEDGGLRVELVYNAGLFDASRMEDLLPQLEALLDQALERPGEPVDALSLVTAAVRAVLPDPTAELPAVWTGPVHARFAERARRHPERPAVADRDGVWTYGGLETAANRLSAWLRQQGVVPGDRVAVLAYRGAPLALALLGILKSGAAFTLLDPAYPAARLTAVLDAAAPRAFLHLEAAGALPEALESWLRGAGCPSLTLPRGGAPDGLPGGAPAVSVNPDDLAYVTFTSGSTGVPKGVLGSHRPLSHFIAWHVERFGLTEEDRFSLLSGLAHDPLLRDVFTPLCLGALLTIPEPEDLTLPDRFAGWMREAGVTVAHLTPALSEVLTEAGGTSLEALRFAFFGGEALTRRTVERLRHLAPGCACVNYYGATETPQGMGFWEVSSADRERIPVGRGIDGVQLLVLNPAGRLAGVGELGEICIRTPYLSLGYLHDEELTRQRFVANPFTGSPADRIYRTGDLGRYLPDGAVEIRGRRDAQVKLRGFRIEPGEIEAALASVPGVSAAAAVVRGDRLVAYVAAAGGIGPAELRSHLQLLLPQPLVPSAFVLLPRLPLTPNGKLDQAALPDPVKATASSEAPEDPLEEILAGIWEDVLEGSRVGLDDDFFQLGGHSLLATRVLSRVQKTFGVTLPVRSLFERPTVRALAALVAEERRRGGADEAPPLVPVGREGRLPLSFAQERLWFLDRLAPESGWYNMPAVLRLEGRVDEPALARALDEIVRRHEALRTRVLTVDGEPAQRIVPATAGLLRVADLSGLPAARREAEAARRIAAEARRPFDLDRGRPLRATLLRLGAEEHALILVAHHIAGDAWSMGLFVRELSALYPAFLAGAPSPLPEPPLQYADFAVWQRSWLRGAPLRRLLDGWRELLGGAPAALELPLDRPRPPVQSFRGGTLSVRFGAAATAALRALSRAEGTTLFMTLLAGFQTLLHRYSGQEEIVVGAPVAGRNREEIEGLIGPFVNTLPLRGVLSGRPAFRDLLARTRETALAAYALQDLPFEKLVEELHPARDLSRPPLFQTLLILQNAPPGRLELPGLALSTVPLNGGTARFELVLSLAETGGALAGYLEHSADLFDRATCERMLAHLATLLAAAAAAPERRVGEIPLLLEGERGQILREWNDTARPPREELLHRLIAEQAARTPERVAVVAGPESLTYRELEARAGRLAERLLRWVGPEVRAGVCLERSLDLPVALLAILKAGGAYLPLDPSYPRERLAYMLEDSNASVVVTREALRRHLPDHGAPTVLLDSNPDADTAAPPGPPAHPGNLAYVLYTSGSTGRPKGVQVPHAALVNFLLAMRERPGLGPEDVLVAVTSLSFDIAGLELFLPLLAGGRVVVASQEEARDGLRLQALLARSGATAMQGTPATWRLLVESGWPGDGRLKALCGGEALPEDLADQLLARTGGLWNLYGPTETTVWSTVEEVAPGRRLAIGRPIANTQAYVLDREGQPAPAGVPGELLLGGSGVVRGYLGRPGLTAERFVPDPFGLPGARLYRTGDLARFRPDGRLEFLGRLDHQVKVRGFRIEPGEIEAALASHPAVAQAVVVLAADGLRACVVPAPGPAPDGPELREHLRSRLPDYMTPGDWVFLPAFPLTPNGKIDRRALAGARRTEAAPSAPYVPPRSGLESTIAAVWRELLGAERVGAHDNFFDLGGHSLLMARVQGRLREQLGREVRMVDLFSHATVESLARHLAAGHRREGDPAAAVRQAERAEQGRDRLRQLRDRRPARA